MPLPSGVRLRESCEVCTASKTKCSKEKPSCKRCSERGTTCQYLVTQKTGRRRRQDSCKEKSPLQVTNQNPTSGPPVPTSVATSTPSQLDPHAGSGPYINAFGDSFNDMGSNSSPDITDSLSKLSPTTDLSMPLIPDYGDPNVFFDKTSFDGTMFDRFVLLNPDSFPNTGTTSANSDAGDAAPMEYQLSSDISSQLSTSHPSLHSASTNNITPSSATTGMDSAEATGIAIQLLQQFSTYREVMLFSTLSHGDPCDTARQRLEHVITCNRQTLSAITTILTPTGSQDVYVLVLICLILNKVVSTYVSALQCDLDAQYLAAGKPSVSTIPPDTVYEENPIALSQLVDELFHVRTSVSLVGKTIRLAAEHSRTLTKDLMYSDADTALGTGPIPTSALVSMHEGLQKRLSELSLKLLEELKQFWT